MQPYIHNAKYYETDQMGIVHHSNYIRWMEEARMDLMSQCGISCRSMEERGVAIPVISVSCKYKGMVRFGDDVAIRVNVSEYNGVRLEFEYEITDCVTGVLRTAGSSSHGFLDRTGRVISLRREYPDMDKLFREMAVSK